MNKQVKYFFAAALCLFLPNVASAADGGYIQGSYSISSLGDVDAPFRSTTDKTWGLDESNVSGNVAVGWKVGKFSLEMKVDYAEGAVDTVDGAAATKGSEYNWAAATIGGLYDVGSFAIDKKSGMALVPYVGVGIGLDGGYMNGQKATSVNCIKGQPFNNAGSGHTACSSGDDRSDYGLAGRGTVGLMLQAHRNLGISLNYDFIAGTAENHVGSAGIRLSF